MNHAVQSFCFHIDTEVCWSMVGTDAERLVTDPEQPTMVLSLQDFPPNIQRNLVIHEFGHALGLEHEHHRSDFWDTVGECFDTEKIIKDFGLLKHSKSGKDARACFEREFKKSSKHMQSAYDADSIMHYW